MWIFRNESQGNGFTSLPKPAALLAFDCGPQLDSCPLDPFASSVLSHTSGNQKCFGWGRWRRKTGRVERQGTVCSVWTVVRCHCGYAETGICMVRLSVVRIWPLTPWFPGLLSPWVTCNSAPSACTAAANPSLYLCLCEHPPQRSNWYWSKHICVSLPDICSVKRSGFCSGDKSRLPHYHILPQISISSSKVSSDFCCCGWGNPAQSTGCQPGSSAPDCTDGAWGEKQWEFGEYLGKPSSFLAAVSSLRAVASWKNMWHI